MTLSFSTQLNGKPTYFIEKIWQSFPDEKIADIFSDFLDGMDMVDYNFSCNAIDMREKIHTIREDKSKRWKIGNKIHFVINNRTPKRYQFAPIVIVKNIQNITITPNSEIFRINIDGQWITDSQIEKLALNDGFESVDDFFNWFKEDFVGVIIHWTNLKY
jgi:hypothetical protein